MRTVDSLSFLVLAGWLALAATAPAQPRPYAGFVYPAGGQRDTTVQIQLGGQDLDGVNAVLVTGSGISAQVVEYRRQLGNQEIQLLREQLKELKQAKPAAGTAQAPMMDAMKSGTAMMAAESTMMMAATDAEKKAAPANKNSSNQELIAKLEQRTREYVQTPACDSIASLVILKVTIAADAEPGERELRLATPKGISNPLPFHVGQLPEFSRKPMTTSTKQVLGKEEQALRRRPAAEVEDRVTVPCTVNGQIASSEANRYRFTARKGQQLVLTTLARQLIPYIADAVPGWFQPVLVLYDASGKEVAYDDDYQFQPDPTILFEVPQDGEYVFAIYDSIYRGREDFVYRISVGELPFVTSIFPLGRQAGAAVTPKMNGWNLQEAALNLPAQNAKPGIQSLVASRKGFISNRVPFALDALPEAFDQEPNNTPAHAQKITLPVILNGRVDQPGDWDVFQFAGKSNDVVVAEVQARRLDSPLDSVLKLTDAAGRLLAFNDDSEDLGAGLNTHHADSRLMGRLPADGTYFVHLGDTAHKGGQAYGYRLRISAPKPDFELRVVPSSVALRSKGTATVTVYAARKDGFSDPIKLALQDPPAGFSASLVTLPGTQSVARLTIKSTLVATEEPVNLFVVGSAKIGEKEITHEAVPAEDRMQAFLWRHLVPASDLKAMVYDPAYQPPPKRALPARPPAIAATNVVGSAGSATAKPKFTKQQITGRLRQLKLLYEEGLLTDNFYNERVAECETPQ
ncbi:MAG: hypothetical protein WCS94_00265 [Verrucomicrobiota bacterium]